MSRAELFDAVREFAVGGQFGNRTGILTAQPAAVVDAADVDVALGTDGDRHGPGKVVFIGGNIGAGEIVGCALNGIADLLRGEADQETLIVFTAQSLIEQAVVGKLFGDAG